MKPVDAVFLLGMEAFCRLHPSSGWPAWFKSAAVPSAQPVSKTLWLYEITVPLLGPLGPHHAWEDLNGRRTLVFIDPETGVKRIVISIGAVGHLEALEAEIDLATRSIDVKRACSPSSLEIPSGLYLWGESKRHGQDGS